MTKRMLIDASHKEETRVVVADDHHLQEYEYESALRRQLRGNIFLAKVTRVEPSLQAAFVNYGGNRHGFLPFTEIHPDYYRVPVADREALLEEQRQQMEEARRAEEEEDEAYENSENKDEEAIDTDDIDDEPVELGAGAEAQIVEEDAQDEDDEPETEEVDSSEEEETEEEVSADGETQEETSEESGEKTGRGRGRRRQYGRGRGRGRGRGGRRSSFNSRRVEMVGGDSIEGDHPIRPNLTRRYKIQEVIKRGQIMLVQVSKEERGNKGAAVTSYLSLPGRYCVLMPNSPRAGGVSRKIANYKDRKRLREILKEFEVPEGMSVIVRTAGVSRTKTEIKRDLDYLMKLWDNIRTTTLESQAPAMIYEEGELVKRSLRDIYDRDTEEVIVEGADGFKRAKEIMKMMIPSHVKRVKEHKDEKTSLFQKYNLEEQISGIGETTAQLKSGGYLVIQQTEALVSIDVNSGRATKERHIEETALRTNLEAAEEVARQLRLRDMGGLVVIDFIDMEDRRNNAKVERKLKNALSTDRARLQVGRISSFGLLELSRQRISASVNETQFERCPHCDGAGVVRTVDSMAIIVLRALESTGAEKKAAEVAVNVTPQVALYLLNRKRARLVDLEQRYELKIMVNSVPDASPSEYEIEVLKTRRDVEQDASDEEDETASEGKDDNQDKRERRGRGGRNRNRRGGRGRGRRNDENAEEQNDQAEEGASEESVMEEAPAAEAEEEKEKKPKRGRKPSKAKAAQKDEVKEAVEENAASEEDTPKEEKPKAKRGRKKKIEEPVEAAIEPGEPSNDDAPEVTEPDNTHAREQEVVNAAPKKKKKGWWSKMVE